MTGRAAIDIGTNSVRLLIVDEAGAELTRRATVTGLGRGIAATGRLSGEGRRRTLEVLAEYRRAVSGAGVDGSRAVVTAVGRRATDIARFLDEAGEVLGLAPEVISGAEEAHLSYTGAVADVDEGDWTVVDIGGGSTEIVSTDVGVSFDVGSVVLTDAYLAARPVEGADLAAARWTAVDSLAVERAPNGVIGVAGTWTSLAGITLELDPYDPQRVHHTRIGRDTIEAWIRRLSLMSVDDTARLPGLEPARAAVILGGTILAAASLDALGADECLVSEHDLLDGIIAGL